MEILAVNTHWFEFGFMVFVAVSAVLGTLLLVIGAKQEYAEHHRKADLVIGISSFVAFAALVVFVAYMINIGPEKTYKAIITDFNEVYESGYEIVSHDGKIYELKKAD